MNVSRAARLRTLGVLAALSATACNSVNHTVGEKGKDESLERTGGGDSAVGVGGNGAAEISTKGASDNGIGGGGGWLTTSINVSSAANTDAGGFVSWGDLPIPDGCWEVNLFQDLAECELEATCNGNPVSSRCFAFDDFFECECPSSLGEFSLTGITMPDACAHALQVCMNWAELESGALECIPTDETDETDFCLWDGMCMFDGVVGDANFAAAYDVQSDCSKDGSGWT